MALKLMLGCWQYDRTRALADGSVQPEGIELEYRSAPQVGAIMERALKGEFDVSELGITYYLRSLELPDPPFIAIPVFPNRLFRHGAIFINKDSGIKEPRDLIGRKVGELHRYGHDAGIWAKGALSDDYGVAADSMTYYVGGLDAPSNEADWATAVTRRASRSTRSARPDARQDAAGWCDRRAVLGLDPALDARRLAQDRAGCSRISRRSSAIISRAPRSFRSCIRW